MILKEIDETSKETPTTNEKSNEEVISKSEEVINPVVKEENETADKLPTKDEIKEKKPSVSVKTAYFF